MKIWSITKSKTKKFKYQRTNLESNIKGLKVKNEKKSKLGNSSCSSDLTEITKSYSEHLRKLLELLVFWVVC